MKKRVTPLSIRKVKKEGTELGTSSDPGTWVSEGEGFGYPPKVFTDSSYPKTSEEEGVKEAHPDNETNTQCHPQ